MLNARAGTNGQVRYDIIDGDPGGHFAVDANSGEVVVMGALDREKRSRYTLTIEAVDQPVDPRDQLSSTSVVSLFVYDTAVK
jgi:protocadherin-16/23